MNSSLKRSDMAHDSKGITQFYLPPKHEPYLPLLRLQSITTFWLVLIVPTHGGMARLSWLWWLVIYWDRFPALGVEPWTGYPSQLLTGPSVGYDWDQRVTTMPNCQPFSEQLHGQKCYQSATHSYTKLAHLMRQEPKILPRNSISGHRQGPTHLYTRSVSTAKQ